MASTEAAHRLVRRGESRVGLWRKEIEEVVHGWLTVTENRRTPCVACSCFPFDAAFFLTTARASGAKKKRAAPQGLIALIAAPARPTHRSRIPGEVHNLQGHRQSLSRLRRFGFRRGFAGADGAGSATDESLAKAGASDDARIASTETNSESLPDNRGGSVSEGNSIFAVSACTSDLKYGHECMTPCTPAKCETSSLEACSSVGRT